MSSLERQERGARRESSLALEPSPTAATPDPDRGERACEHLIEAVYRELHDLARQYLSRERGDHILQPTALVHEAYLRVVDGQESRWNDETHFLAVAARAMRQVLIDHVRASHRAKRGGGWQRVDLDDAVRLEDQTAQDLESLNSALSDLARLSPRQARIVELRFFAGASVETTAEVIGLSPRTVGREWRFARAWLGDAIHRRQG